jgi:hypothetical protein
VCRLNNLIFRRNNTPVPGQVKIITTPAEAVNDGERGI